MHPRIHVITLAVEDLDRAVGFYRDGLGLETPGVVGSEFAGDDANPAGAVAMFRLQGDLVLALYPRTELAKDARLPPGPPSSGEFSIGHAVADKAEVDALLARAEAAGASLSGVPHDRPWGIYSGYFRDPDGHLWEIIWNPQPRGPLRKVDCVQIPVPDLDSGLAFYRDRLGHELIWRSQTAAGLRLADSDTELVLQTQQPQPEVDLLVHSVDQAATQLTRAGGTVLVEPVDIPVGRVAVVADPFGNPLTILDLTKGRYVTDADGNVTGVTGPTQAPATEER
jgi:uncharacterized protein